MLTAVIDFVDEHPGGAKILKRVAGKDATKQFWKYHSEGVLKKFQPQLKVGSLDTKKQAAPPTPPPSPPAQKAVAKPAAKSAPAEEEVAEPLEPFGDLVPYADPSWYQSVCYVQPDHPSTAANYAIVPFALL